MIRKVRVFGTDVTIRLVKDKSLDDAWADFDPETKEIRLGRDVPRLQKQEAILHELMHAIETEWGFEMNHEHLTLMARGIIFVIRDNPKLVKVLFGR